MVHIREHGGDREHFPHYGNSLYERDIVDNRIRSGEPGKTEKTIRNYAAQNEKSEMRRGASKDLSEDISIDDHHHEGIQQGPQDSQRHVAVADLEILQDQELSEMQHITFPNHASLLRRCRRRLSLGPIDTYKATNSEARSRAADGGVAGSTRRSAADAGGFEADSEAGVFEMALGRLT